MPSLRGNRESGVRDLRRMLQAGIAHLLAVYLPDTRQPEKDVGEFAALRHFAEIMPA